MLVPKGQAEGVARAHSDLEETVELLRLLIADPSRWKDQFTSGSATCLNATERLALPGQTENVFWVGSDATKGRFSATEYGEKLYAREDIGDF